MKRRLSVLLLGLVAALAPTGAASAEVSGGGANNVVNVVNSSGTVLRGHGSVAVFGGDSLQSSNIASALSENCTGCHSRAVAVQEVVVTGDPADFRPANAASAVNASCTDCTTVAYAYQNVVQSTAGAYLSPETRQTAMLIVAEIQGVAADPSISDVPTLGADGRMHSELTDTLDALVAELDGVVEGGLLSNGSSLLGSQVYRQAEAVTG